MLKPKYSDLISTLLIVKWRPGMFISRESLELIDTFIGGFEICRIAHQIAEDRSILAWSDFIKWIHKKYDICDNRGWVRIIQDMHKPRNEKQAYDIFFQELDEFIKSSESSKWPEIYNNFPEPKTAHPITP